MQMYMQTPSKSVVVLIVLIAVATAAAVIVLATANSYAGGGKPLERTSTKAPNITHFVKARPPRPIAITHFVELKGTVKKVDKVLGVAVVSIGERNVTLIFRGPYVEESSGTLYWYDEVLERVEVGSEVEVKGVLKFGILAERRALIMTVHQINVGGAIYETPYLYYIRTR